MIEFAGIRSDERHLIIEHYPKRFFPRKKYTTESIPGGSRTFYIPEAEDAFENYSQPYSVFMDAKAPGLSMVARGLAEWLLAPSGYQRLEDSYDPDFYRMAIYAGGENFLNHFNEYGRGTLTFDCAPKRFYKSGELPVNISDGMKLYSPSRFKAHPIVTINGTGSCSVYITDDDGNTKTFSITDVLESVVVDSEMHTAFEGSTNMNNKVSTSYDTLYLGNASTISWNENVTDVIIVPRWWTI